MTEAYNNSARLIECTSSSNQLHGLSGHPWTRREYPLEYHRSPDPTTRASLTCLPSTRSCGMRLACTP